MRVEEVHQDRSRGHITAQRIELGEQPVPLIMHVGEARDRDARFQILGWYALGVLRCAFCSETLPMHAPALCAVDNTVQLCCSLECAQAAAAYWAATLDSPAGR